MCAAIFNRVFPRSAPPFSTGLNTSLKKPSMTDHPLGLAPRKRLEQIRRV
jgi:hypothetical protein